MTDHSFTHSAITGFVIVLLLSVFRAYRRRQKAALPQNARFAHAVALAQPYLVSIKAKNYISPEANTIQDDLVSAYRVALLQYFGLPHTLDLSGLQHHVSSTFDTIWFQTDLKTLKPTDKPLPALAFACARTAFVTRLLSDPAWIPPETAVWILSLNLQRAQDCFESWKQFRDAYVEGRAQWLSGLRPDAFCMRLTDATIASWFTTGEGAWQNYPWATTTGFTENDESWCPLYR